MNDIALSKPLNEREIRRGLRVNILAGSLGMAFVAVAFGVPITMLLERLGATGAQIGLLATFQQVAMLAQIPAALIAPRLASRKIGFASLALAHRALWFVPALLPLLARDGAAPIIWAIIGVVAVSSMMAQASSPLWFSWISDLVPERESGRFWGRRQSIVTFSFLAMTAFSGWMLDTFAGTAEEPRALVGFSLVFGIGALLGVADIVVHLWVPEPPIRTAAARPVWWRLLADPLRQADFRQLTLLIGIWAFSLGLIGSFGLVYLRREFAVGYLHLSALSLIASVGTAIAGAATGLLLDRIGARGFAAFLFFVCPLMGASWFLISRRIIAFTLWGATVHLPQPIVVIGAVNLVSGAIYSSVGLCHFKMLGELAPKGIGRTPAMAVHWTAIGLIGAAGSWLGGLFMDHFPAFDPGWSLPFGVPWSFFHWLLIAHALICWLVVAPLMLRIRRRGDDLPLGAVISQLRPANPLRTVGMVYDMWVAVSTESSHTRARAIRRLGERRAEVAVRDLIRKLDDPSAEVREEAALALGQIGGDEAVNALIEELRDPQTDLALPVARALRRARDPRSVDALVGALETADRETAAESARALGAIGDPRAAEALREMLRSTRDIKLAAASGEALARLGSIDAIYDILPRIKSSANPVLRHSLSVAVGDLLGEPGEFYRILNREQEAAGIEVERLLRDIRNLLEKEKDPGGEPALDQLQRQTFAMQTAYDEGRIAECAGLLLQWARAFTAEFPPPAAAGPGPARDLAARTAVTLWFLELLNRHWADVDLGHRDRTDLLLGIYALYALVRATMDAPAAE